jgi:uncharacterized protein (TIGR03067 family)
VQGILRHDKTVFKGDKWHCTSNGTTIQQGTITIVEATEKLVKIDFIVMDGYARGDTWKAVYEMDGDEVRWCGCFAGGGRNRPDDLVTRAGDGRVLRTLKREK